MLTNTDVTIWHIGYDKQTRMDTAKQVYKGRASCQADIITTVDNGLQSADVIKLRIPTTETLEISNGDRIVLELSEESTPPKEAFTILHFSDNRKLSQNMWHYKIICS